MEKSTDRLRREQKAAGEPAPVRAEELLRQLLQEASPRPPARARQGEGRRVLLDLEVDGARYQLLRSATAPSRRSHHLLSGREGEIVELVAHDYTNRMIATALGISRWTVFTHLRRIFSKLGVSSRAAMVAELLGELNQAPRPAPARAAVAAGKRLAVSAA